MIMGFVCPNGTPALPGPWRRAGRLFRKGPVLLLLGALALLAAGCSHSGSDTPPAITAQPQSASVITGRPVSFSVTASGTGALAYQWAKDGKAILGAQAATLTLYNPGLQDAGQYVVTVSNTLGTAASTPAVLTVAAGLTFTSPFGVVSDATGNLYVSDAEDHAIWKVDSTGLKTLLAGSPGVPGSADGIGSAAQFRFPGGLAFDPAGNLLVADTGNDTLRRIAPDGTVTTLAGSAGMPGTTDAVGTAARFNAPIGLAVDTLGVAYLGDSGNHTIRRVATDGTVTTYAGLAGQPGFLNGSAATAQFNEPNGVALAADGTLYVADYGNSCIRAISPTGTVSTLAGQPGTHGSADGTGGAAAFYWPVGLAVDGAGNVWVADTYNHALRKILAGGAVSTLAGSGGTLGNLDGTGTAARFDLPCGVALTPSGDLVVADTGNHFLRRVTTAGVVTTFTAP
jgi:sugar lactone lactonase YvrE